MTMCILSLDYMLKIHVTSGNIKKYELKTILNKSILID